MIDTNALLSAAFSLIASFTNLVSVPPNSAPQRVEDTEMYAINPSIPTALIVRSRGGFTYSISQGVVDGYSTPGSYFSLGDIRQIDRFTGVSSLTTNDVLALATKTLAQLSKCGDPFGGLMPQIEQGGEYKGKRIPFFKVAWLYPPPHLGSSTAASVEIDGRNGQIVELKLFATNFMDCVFDKQLSQKIFRSEETKKSHSLAQRMALPRPNTGQATQAIHNGFVFCRRFGLDSEKCTNFFQIDWDNSFLYKDTSISSSSLVCRITFTNNACFDSIEGKVFNYFRQDAFFIGLYESRPQSDWNAIQGKGKIDWKELADNLQRHLTNLLKDSTYKIPKVVPIIRSGGPDAGFNSIGMTRVVVEWREWHTIAEPTPASEFPLLFSAEFDLQTGQTEFISIDDPELRQALGEAISNEPRAK